MSKEQWVCFYHPDGRFLGGYTLTGTFAGEAQATKELLAAENGIQPHEIKTQLQNKPPKEEQRNGKGTVKDTRRD